MASNKMCQLIWQIIYQGSIASVSQWSNDQTWWVPQVLIRVFNFTVDDANTDIIIAPVVTQLG